MKKLFLAATAAIFGTFASADVVSRTNMPVDGGFAYAVTINTGGSLVYLTTAEILDGRTPATDRQVIIADLDIYDPETVAAFAAEQFGGSFEVSLHDVYRATPGPDMILGTPDDGRKLSRQYW